MYDGLPFEEWRDRERASIRRSIHQADWLTPRERAVARHGLMMLEHRRQVMQRIAAERNVATVREVLETPLTRAR